MRDPEVEYLNKHADETCLIVGNGPSLKDVPNEFLAKYPSFGSNRIYLKFIPTYYVCVNPLVADIFKEDIDHNVLTPKFITDEVAWEETIPLHSMQTPMFSYAPFRYLYEGYTVTFVAMQLAFWMGFTTALLVGVDHRYVFEGKPNEERIMQGDDPNNFDPTYFKGVKWNNPDLEKSEVAYRMAEDAYFKNGRMIVNLTPNSALNVFPIGELDQWM